MRMTMVLVGVDGGFRGDEARECQTRAHSFQDDSEHSQSHFEQRNQPDEQSHEDVDEALRVASGAF